MGLRGVEGDQLRRRSLQGNRALNFGRVRGDARNRGFDASMAARHFVDRIPDFIDIGTDAIGGDGGLMRQLLDFTGDHGKTAPSVACARSFDRRVERQQVHLTRDFANQVDHRFDRCRRDAQIGSTGAACRYERDRLVSGLTRLVRPGGNGVERICKFAASTSNFLHMRTGLYGRSGNGGSAGADLGRPLRHLGSVVFQHARQLVHHLAQSRNFALETLCGSLDLVGARNPVAGSMTLPFTREQRQSAVGQHAEQSVILQDHHAFGSSSDPILLQGRTDRLRDIGPRAIANVRPQVAPISRIAQQGMAIGVEQ